MKKNRTLRERMLLVALIMAIPILAIFLIVNIYVRDEMRKEVLENYQAEAKEEAVKTDVLLNVLEGAIGKVPLNNSDLREVLEKKETDNDFWLANQRLMNQMNGLAEVFPVHCQMFIYFPEKDIFYNNQAKEELSNVIKRRFLDKKWKNAEKWEIISIKEEEFFVYVLDYEKYCVGCWISEYDLQNFLQVDAEKDFRCCFEKIDKKADAGGKNLSVIRLVDKKDVAWYQISVESSRLAGQLMFYVDEKLVEKKLPSLTDGFWKVFFIGILILIAYNWGIYRWMIFPIEKMRRSMETIQEGNTKYRIPELENSCAEIQSVVEQFNEMLDELDCLQYEFYKGELERQEIELQYLSHQIQPHFILNTLNTLYNYSEDDIQTAREIIRLTSKYYRYVVNTNSKYVQIGQELEHIGNYLKLQKIRYPRTFEYEISCNESLDAIPIPPFLVESFVSNAVKYGRSAGELIQINIQVEEIEKFQIRIQISDTGKGFSENMLDILEEYLKTGDASDISGIGIINSIQRLRLIYRDRAFIRFYNQKPRGAVVEIEISLQKKNNNYCEDSEVKYGNKCFDCR